MGLCKETLQIAPYTTPSSTLIASVISWVPQGFILEPLLLFTNELSDSIRSSFPRMIQKRPKSTICLRYPYSPMNFRTQSDQAFHEWYKNVQNQQSVSDILQRNVPISFNEMKSLSSKDLHQALRYGWEPVKLPSNCACNEPFTVSHALHCPKGGYTHIKVRYKTGQRAPPAGSMPCRLRNIT